MIAKKYDVAVIGGGPAGMMAAISAAKIGAKVILLEKNDRLGLKLLATGNGRCNITNRNITSENYYGSAKKMFDKIYSCFDNKKLETFFKNLGVEFVNDERGRVFPSTDKAITVRDALIDALEESSVDVRKSTLVRDLRNLDGYQIFLENNEIVNSETIILTTGGKAAHRLGSSGDGLFWSRKLGHRPTDIYAALVPIELECADFISAMGVKMRVMAIAKVSGKVVGSKDGDLLFTHYGVSGPAAMGIAGRISPYIGKEKTEIVIDLLPDTEASGLDKKIVKFAEEMPKKKVTNIISEIMPLKLASSLIDFLDIDGNKNISELSKNDRMKLIKNIKNLTLEIKKVRPLREAQVTSGGISADEINIELASKIAPGLYFAGEIIDIDGDSGGYNLQWAWSSGYVAGVNAARKAK